MPETTPRQPIAAPAQGEFVRVGECLYRHRPSGNYYGFTRKGGKQFHRSLRTKDRKLAERRLAELRSKVGGFRASGETGRTGFGDFAKAWAERRQHHLKPGSYARLQLSVGQLTRHFGSGAVRNIGRAECETWAAERGPQIASSTFNKERETLIAILEDARESGLILDNPARALRRRKLEKGGLAIPSRAQFAQLLSAMRTLDPRARPGVDLVELLAYSGMRLGEAVSLTWRDVDFEREVFVVTGGAGGTKNREARTVPLFPALKAFLERVRSSAASPPVPEATIVGIGDAKRAVDSACRKAKLPHLSHHTFRHFFVSNAIEHGVDFKTIAAWVGHKDGGVLVAKTYGHLRDTHSAEMARRMSFMAPAPSLSETPRLPSS